MLPADFARCAEKEFPLLEDFDNRPVCERLDDEDLRDFEFEELLAEPPIRVVRDLPVARTFEDPL